MLPAPVSLGNRHPQVRPSRHPSGGRRREFAAGQVQRVFVLKALHCKGVALSRLARDNLEFDDQAYIVYDGRELRACRDVAAAIATVVRAKRCCSGVDLTAKSPTRDQIRRAFCQTVRNCVLDLLSIEVPRFGIQARLQAAWSKGNQWTMRLKQTRMVKILECSERPGLSMMDIEDERNHMGGALSLRDRIGQPGTPAAE
jgi:hypothetical protein